MEKATRLAFLKTRHAELFGVALERVLPVTRPEIAATAKAVKAKVAAAMDDDISDTDKIESKISSLSFDVIPESVEKDSEILLSRKEKQQLAREVAARRAVQARLSLPLMLTA